MLDLELSPRLCIGHPLFAEGFEKELRRVRPIGCKKPGRVLSEIIRIGGSIFDHAGDVVSHHRVKLGIEYCPDQAAIRVDCAGDPVCSKANLEGRRYGHGLRRFRETAHKRIGRESLQTLMCFHLSEGRAIAEFYLTPNPASSSAISALIPLAAAISALPPVLSPFLSLAKPRP